MIEAVEFSVSYGYREYRSFCFDHIPSEFPDLKLGWITRMIISAALFVPFTYKTTKMPVCHFRLDGAGIRRRTKLSLTIATRVAFSLSCSVNVSPASSGISIVEK